MFVVALTTAGTSSDYSDSHAGHQGSTLAGRWAERATPDGAPCCAPGRELPDGIHASRSAKAVAVVGRLIEQVDCNEGVPATRCVRVVARVSRTQARTHPLGLTMLALPDHGCEVYSAWATAWAVDQLADRDQGRLLIDLWRRVIPDFACRDQFLTSATRRTRGEILDERVDDSSRPVDVHISIDACCSES